MENDMKSNEYINKWKYDYNEIMENDEEESNTIMTTNKLMK